MPSQLLGKGQIIKKQCRIYRQRCNSDLHCLTFQGLCISSNTSRFACQFWLVGCIASSVVSCTEAGFIANREDATVLDNVAFCWMFYWTQRMTILEPNWT